MSAQKRSLVQKAERAELLPIAAAVEALVAGSTNWVSITGLSASPVVSPATQVAPGTSTGFTCVAAIALTAKVTGIFRVDCHVTFSDNTAADTITHDLRSLRGAGTAVGINASGGSVTPEGAMGTGASPSVGAVIGGNAAGADGLQFNAVSFATSGTIQNENAQASVAGALTGNAQGAQHYDFSAIVGQEGVTSSTRTPFTVGNSCAFGLLVNASDTILYESIVFTVQELGAA